MEYSVLIQCVCIIYMYVYAGHPTRGDNGVTIPMICMKLPNCDCTPIGSDISKLKVNCAMKNLTNVPQNLPTTSEILMLQENKITRIHNYSFQDLPLVKELYLSHNVIYCVETAAFSGLGNLNVLSIEGNRIKYTDSWNEALSRLPNLRILSMEQSLSDWSQDEMFPLNALSSMSNLTSLFSDGIPRVGLNKLLKLERISYTASYGRRCNISTLTTDMFATLVNLSVIQLHQCSITSIEQGMIAPLTRLKRIELSSNTDMEFKVIHNLTYGIWNTSLVELWINNIHPPFGECTKLTKYDLEYMKHSKLEIINVSSNRLSFVEDSAVDYLAKTLKDLNLNKNLFLFGRYIPKIIINHILDNIEVIYLSNQHLSMTSESFSQAYEAFAEYRNSHNQYNVIHGDNHTIKTSDPYCSVCNDFPNHRPIPLPQNLTQLHMNDSSIHIRLSGLCFCNPNKLAELYLGGNYMNTLEGRFPGLSSLRILDISRNKCENITSNTFRDMPNLVKFFAMDNFLSFPLENDVNGLIFSWCSKLEYLHLRNNKLRFLPTNLFKGLVGVKYIDLSDNHLFTFNLNIDGMVSLRTLLLNENNIDFIDKQVCVHLDQLSKQFGVFVNLNENNLKCNCGTKEFTYWISDTHVHLIDLDKYTCVLSNDSRVEIKHSGDLKLQLQRHCASYKIVITIAAVFILLMITVTLSGIVYRYRWDLRYFYYYAKIKLKNTVNVEHNNEIEYEADAFVSYNERERDFVYETLIPRLESARGVRLCVHERNFRTGYITENIARAIMSSRKTLILLSTSFIESNMCRYEINMARMEGIKTGRSVLCLVMMENIDVGTIPLEIMDIIRELTYINLPNDNDNLDIFLDRLKASIYE